MLVIVIYLTEPKILFKFGLFTNKWSWTSFKRVESNWASGVSSLFTALTTTKWFLHMTSLIGECSIHHLLSQALGIHSTNMKIKGSNTFCVQSLLDIFRWSHNDYWITSKRKSAEPKYMLFILPPQVWLQSRTKLGRIYWLQLQIVFGSQLIWSNTHAMHG